MKQVKQVLQYLAQSQNRHTDIMVQAAEYINRTYSDLSEAEKRDLLQLVTFSLLKLVNQ